MRIDSLYRGQKVKVFGLPAVVEAAWYGAHSFHAAFAVDGDDYVTDIGRVVLHQNEGDYVEPA